MNNNPRAVVAYIAARLISGGSPTSIYDYSRSNYVNIDGQVSSRSINVFDYDQSCYITGNSNGSKFSFHYGNSSYIDFEIRDNKFKGFDYGTSSYYEGKVSGKSINIFDYQNSSYFDYSV